MFIQQFDINQDIANSDLYMISTKIQIFTTLAWNFTILNILLDFCVKVINYKGVEF